MSVRSWFYKGIGGFAAGLVMAASVLTPIGAAYCSAALVKAPVTITIWGQSQWPKDEIASFERTHPDIKVNAVTVPTLSTKLRTALQAGSGAPDVTQIEYRELPSFILTGKLVDLSQYGASALLKQFVPWTRGQVSQGSKVYAIPVDQGPLALLYRKDIFAKYHLSVPQTWAQYAQDAVTLHRLNSSVYLANSPISDGMFDQMLWQANARPFTVSGSTVSIALNNATSLKIASYWGKLEQAKAVAQIAPFTPSWDAALTNGTFATWIGAGWAPGVLEPIAQKSSGQWAVAKLPQWTAGTYASANFGGSTSAVTSQSAHPKEAAEFAMWYGGDRQSSTVLTTKYHILPALLSVLDNRTVIDKPDPFFGGQAVAEFYAQAAQHVDTTFQWSPFQDYVDEQLTNNFGRAEKGQISYAGAMQATQSTVVAYAKKQGFTVR